MKNYDQQYKNYLLDKFAKRVYNTYMVISTYSDEYIDVYLKEKPITTLGQVKRLYSCISKMEKEETEKRLRKILLHAIETKEIPAYEYHF